VWHPDPDQLTLAALPAEPHDPAVEAHLAECRLCRSHVASLRRTVDLAVAGAGDDSEYGDPPDRVWAAITGELDIAPGSPPAPAPWWRRAAVPVAAALVALAAGLGLGYLAGDTSPAPRPLAVLGPVDDGNPGGTGTAGLTDEGALPVLLVRVEGTDLPPDADYLEAWLMDPTGTRLVSLGALAWDGSAYRGEFSVPPDLPTEDFGVLDVSAERWDGDERHSRQSLLRGTLA
jgi:hypothetical protein